MYDLSLSQPKLKELAIFYGVPITIFIVLMAILTSLFSNAPHPSIEIDGLPTDRYREEVEEELYNTVIKNVKAAAFKRPIARVRDGSILEMDGAYSFLVDLDLIEQSYRIQISSASDPGGYLYMVSCPDETELIYEQPFCTDTFAFSIEDILPATIPIQSPLLEEVGQNYPVPTNDPSVVTISLKKSDTYSYKNQSLNYSVVACGDEDIALESFLIVKNWIAISGFDPEDYQLNFIDGCENQP